jgi:hypothetical protein
MPRDLFQHHATGSEITPARFKALQDAKKDLALRADALDAAGEIGRASLIENIRSADPHPMWERLIERIITLPLYDFPQFAAELKQTMSKQPYLIATLENMPWGNGRPKYVNGTTAAIGTVTLVAEPVKNYRPVPQLQRRTGSRADDARRLETILNGGEYTFGVLTSAARVALHGELRTEIKRQMKLFKNIRKLLNKFGAKLVARSTEITVNRDGAYVHHNLFITKTKNQDKINAGIELISGSIYHDMDVVRDAKSCAEYAIKEPVAAKEAPELLHDPAIASWLFHALRGHRFVEFSRSDNNKANGPLIVHDSEETPLSLIAPDSDGIGASPALSPQRRQQTKQKAASDNHPASLGIHADGSATTIKEDGAEEENAIVKIRRPNFHVLPQREPVLIIRNHTNDPKTAVGKDNLKKIQEIHEASLREWRNNCAADPIDALKKINRLQDRVFYFGGELKNSVDTSLDIETRLIAPNSSLLSVPAESGPPTTKTFPAKARMSLLYPTKPADADDEDADPYSSIQVYEALWFLRHNFDKKPKEYSAPDYEESKYDRKVREGRNRLRHEEWERINKTAAKLKRQYMLREIDIPNLIPPDRGRHDLR